MDVEQRRTSALRDASPGAASDVSNSSGTSEENIEAGLFVKKDRAHHRLWARILPASLSRKRQSRTNAAFEKWKSNGRRRVSSIALILIAAAVIMVAGISLLIYFTIHFKRMIPRNDVQRMIASWGQPNTMTESLAHYPTDFSRDINPIPCHSHNDYERRVPLYDALAAGCVGVEADVWFTPTDLLVGHKLGALTQSRTLKSLYIDPIMSILSHQNPKSGPLGANATSLNGVFDASPDTPLILLIDIKTDGAKTFAAVEAELEPLRAGGWLTYFNGSAVVPGLVTVVGSGNTPFGLITANTTYRDIFFDAPIEQFWGEGAPSNASLYTAENSYYASTNFQAAIGNPWHGILTPQQVETMRGQVGEAQKRGLKARYWQTPSWPVSTREHVWDVLEKEGVGMLNVDDLEAASKRNWDNRR